MGLVEGVGDGGFGEEAGLLEGHTGCEELTAEGSALQTDVGGFTAPGSGAEGGDGFHAGPGTDRTGLFDELVEEEGIHGLGDFFEGGDGFFNLLDGLLELLDGLFEGFTGGGLLEPFGKVVEFFVLLVTDGFEVLPDVGKLVDEVGKLLALRAVHGLWGYAGWIGWLGIRNGRGKGYGEGEDFNIWDPDHPGPARKPGRAPAAAHYPEPAADNPEPSLPTTQLTELLKPRWTCSRIERM